MQTAWRPFFSYNLWSLFEPAIGQEQWHCPMKRGFLKARAKEPEIAPLIQQETVYQKIGLLAQQGIYEFHQDLYLLSCKDGVAQVSRVSPFKVSSFSSWLGLAAWQLTHGSDSSVGSVSVVAS